MATREEMIAELRRRDMIKQLEARQAGYAPAAQITQEMHPAISSWTRFVAKNFASNPQAAMGYLKSKLPDGADVREVQGQIGVKLPGETNYRALDPSTGAISSDTLHDIGDVAYDVGAGAAQGVATGLGAVGGGLVGALAGPAGVGPGIVAGESLAGGAAGAGLESLKQRIGTALGIPNNENEGAVQMAGALGVALPAVGNAGKGLYNLARNKVGPAVASTVSGVPSKVWSQYSQDPAAMDALAKDPAALLALRKDVQQGVVGAYKKQVGAAGKEMEQALAGAEASGASVDISGIKADLDARVAKAAALAEKSPTAQNRAKLEDLQSIKMDYFTHKFEDPNTKNITYQVMPDMVPPSVAMGLKGDLRNLASPVAGAASKLKNASDKEIMNFGNQGIGALSDSLEASVPGLDKASSRYATLQEETGQVYPAFKDVQTTANTVRNMDSQAKAVLKDRLNKTLPPDELSALHDKMQTLQTQGYLGDPASMPLSGLGTTSTSRSIPLSEGLGDVGYVAGRQTGSGGASAGRAIGRLLGGTIGSPATIKKGYKLLDSAERGVNAADPGQAARYGLGLSAWEAIQKRQE